MTGVGHHWTRQADTVVQGVTRSSKSGWTYGALAQMAGRPELLIAGCDPAGLLWRQIRRLTPRRESSVRPDRSRLARTDTGTARRTGAARRPAGLVQLCPRGGAW